MRFWLRVLAVVMIILGWSVVVWSAASIDVRFGQRTVLVADPNARSLTLVPGSAAVDIWVCVPYSVKGRLDRIVSHSCKDAAAVMDWILANDPQER